LVSRRDLYHWPGLGAAFALFLLLVPEAMLHTDGFFYRYRAVFAAGRAMDKLRYVEATVPTLLIVGNSRVDNGFDPGAIADACARPETPAPVDDRRPRPPPPTPAARSAATRSA